MGYDIALSKAWEDLRVIANEKNYNIRFLNESYDVEPEKKAIFAISRDTPPKPYASILILHYLAGLIKGFPPLTGEWVSFRELPGGYAYHPVFKKRAADIISRKYGQNPKELLGIIGRFNAKKVELADAGIALKVFDDVPVLITLWCGDEEMGPEANILFDKNITDIFCTEDIVVLAEQLAHSI
ncbi:MAG: DUF3786 domain-containing protein [Candidatus Omnitrophica bacterium]|nr:DUF3786 domain-containing protein [Candidatus Omnitrophota bacterium]